MSKPQSSAVLDRPMAAAVAEPICLLRVEQTQPRFFEAKHARQVLGILGMLIQAVGKESLLGAILTQTRAEVVSLLDSNP